MQISSGSRTGAALTGPLATVTLALALAAPSAGFAQAYDRDARLPRHGSLWIEFAPSWEIWSEQFTEGGDGGSRQPLHSDYDGPIVNRLFPGLDPLLADLNRDATALGYDSLVATDVSLGSTVYGSITRDVRTVPLGLSFGLFGRLAVDLSVPLVRGTVESSFAFDSTTAGFVPSSTVVAAPDQYFGSFDAVRSDLEALVEGGTLPPDQQAAALQLLDASGAYRNALASRVDDDGLLPIASSDAGVEMSGRYADLSAGYQAFGLELPGFTLPDSAQTSDFQRILGSPPIGLDSLQTTVRGWSPGEIAVGLRVLLLDTFDPILPVDEARFRSAREPDLRGGGIRFRTSAGARFRLPLSAPDADPYLVASSALQQPIGTGATSAELGLWQDAQFGRWLWVVGSLRYVLQLEDELVVRVRTQGSPFAYAAQERTVSRDLGDIFELRLSPRFRLNETLSLGLEYRWRSKGEDSYTGAGGPDPSPLGAGTGQTRHRLGIGGWYRTTPRYLAGIANFPVELALIWQGSIAGGGGMTPASDIVTFSLRVPLQLF
ncbi:MAG: hypothetical protein P8049_11685 [Gemmatimonadota bacterium]